MFSFDVVPRYLLAQLLIHYIGGDKKRCQSVGVDCWPKTAQGQKSLIVWILPSSLHLISAYLKEWKYEYDLLLSIIILF